MTGKTRRVIIIGGGAAGYFAAITCAETNPDCEVIVLEKASKVLQKVKVSGGGRCNVTHACFDPRELVSFYPRGSKALIGPFNQFQPGDTMGWYEERGVSLKIEDDNRVFPVSDNSQSIIDCLTKAAADAGVEVRLKQQVNEMIAPTTGDERWKLLVNETTMEADAVMVAAGSSKQLWKQLEDLGHNIVEPVPSLFTFNIKDERIDGLMGLATPAEIRVQDTKLEAYGPTLITHWGMSGPGVLRLSSWGARELANRNYEFTITVNWLPDFTLPQMIEQLKEMREALAKKVVCARSEFEIPTRLYKKLVDAAGINAEMRWADLSNAHIQRFATELVNGEYNVKGKSTFKEEFVTCGGINLNEVNFKRMESKLFPGLHFAGEILDIDAITGGFNFQAAWTGGYIAGNAMAAY